MGRAFRLHKLEGLSHAETARAMGISVKVVEKHVSAALKALTRRLSP
jgi:DNA-directed RNA polymerase specialized sigma24 family protein